MDRRAFLRFIPAAALAGSLIGCASQGDNKPADTSGMKFSEADRNAIISHYQQGRSRAPAQEKPAQAAMPGGRMPSGARPNKLPTDLDAKLSKLADPYTRLTLGADVVLVNRDTHDILDVIPQMAY
ncbi:MAG: hypothetical protein HZB71_13615 [Betaproteobacteria bacterium]|nr:hypothetical protein [Betaproteobacteria bacterium]